jgi:hypothetical protein
MTLKNLNSTSKLEFWLNFKKNPLKISHKDKNIKPSKKKLFSTQNYWHHTIFFSSFDSCETYSRKLQSAVKINFTKALNHSTEVDNLFSFFDICGIRATHTYRESQRAVTISFSMELHLI